MKSVAHWLNNNLMAVILVLCFIPIYIYSQITGTAFEHWGSTSMEYLNHEYFRWLTCIFLHFNFVHIFFHSLALLAVGSLVSPLLVNGELFFCLSCAGYWRRQPVL